MYERMDWASAVSEPPTPVSTEPEKVTLTKADLDEQMRRERQSAADKARQEAADAQTQRDANARYETQQRQALRTNIDLLAKAAINETGELKPDFAENVAAQYEGMYFEKGRATAAGTLQSAALEALGQVEGVLSPDADLTPLERAYKTPHEFYANLYEVAVKVGEQRAAKAAEARIAREVAKQTRIATEAISKELRDQIRQGNPDAGLPSGTAATGRITDKDIAEHSGDPQWWEDNRETYFKQQGLTK